MAKTPLWVSSPSFVHLFWFVLVCGADNSTLKTKKTRNAEAAAYVLDEYINQAKGTADIAWASPLK